MQWVPNLMSTSDFRFQECVLLVSFHASQQGVHLASKFMSSNVAIDIWLLAILCTFMNIGSSILYIK